MLLWEEVSFGTYSFVTEVAKDERLKEELGCRHSVCLERTGIVSALWKHAISNVKAEDLNDMPSAPKRLSQKNLRRWYADVGRLLGVDSLMRAVEAGVPVHGDILTPIDAARLIPDKTWMV